MTKLPQATNKSVIAWFKTSEYGSVNPAITTLNVTVLDVYDMETTSFVDVSIVYKFPVNEFDDRLTAKPLNDPEVNWDVRKYVFVINFTPIASTTNMSSSLEASMKVGFVVVPSEMMMLTNARPPYEVDNKSSARFLLLA